MMNRDTVPASMTAPQAKMKWPVQRRTTAATRRVTTRPSSSKPGSKERHGLHSGPQLLEILDKTSPPGELVAEPLVTNTRVGKEPQRRHRSHLLGDEHPIEQIPQGIALEICGPGRESAVASVRKKDAHPDSALDAFSGSLLVDSLDYERRGRNPVVIWVHCGDLEEDVRVWTWHRPGIDGFDHESSMIALLDLPKAPHVRPFCLCSEQVLRFV